MITKRRQVATAAVLIIGVAATMLAAEEFDLTRRTVDGGGVMRSVAGGLELSGTIGQPDAGRMSAQGLELTGGFWFEIEPADCNEDGGVDLFDFASFQGCLQGPGSAVDAGNPCACFDLSGDGAVDLRDVALIQAMTNG